MQIKLVKDGKARALFDNISHIQLRYEVDSPNFQVELRPLGEVLSLPEDGSDIFVMNDSGDTIDRYSVKEPQHVQAT